MRVCSMATTVLMSLDVSLSSVCSRDLKLQSVSQA